MFEKEEELKTVDCKEPEYRRLYRKNLAKYRRRGLELPYLEIWPQKRCDLRCQHCMRLIPYVEEKELETAQTVRDLACLLRAASVKRLVIAGGNPFLCRDLAFLIRFAVRNSRIGRVEVRTNGSTLPDGETLQALKEAGTSVRVCIHGYAAVGERARRLERLLAKSGIPCVFRQYEGKRYREWKMTGGPFQQFLHFETARFIYRDCRMKNRAALCDGILTACPRGIHAGTLFPLQENAYEHVHVRSLKADAASRARIAVCMDRNIYKDYCQYCLGLTDENPYFVTPGEQYPDEFERKREKR